MNLYKRAIAECLGTFWLVFGGCGSAVLAAAGGVPFVISAWAIRLLTRLPQKSVSALATNVPGPRGRQRVLGRDVLEILPVPPIALSLRTGIAMLSYADRFCFGITADYDSAPDVDALARGIEDGVRRLAALGGSKALIRSNVNHR